MLQETCAGEGFLQAQEKAFGIHYPGSHSPPALWEKHRNILFKLLIIFHAVNWSFENLDTMLERCLNVTVCRIIEYPRLERTHIARILPVQVSLTIKSLSKHLSSLLVHAIKKNH